MIRKQKTGWRDKYQTAAWELLVAKVFKDGVQFKHVCIVELSKKLLVSKETIYKALRSGTKNFNPDSPKILKILEAFDPVMAQRFMCEPRNTWAKSLNRPPKTLEEIGERIQQKEAEIASLHALYHEHEKARILKKKG